MQIPIPGTISPTRGEFEPTSVAGSQFDCFNDEDTLFGPDNQIARTLDAERRLVVFSRVSFIEIVHWPTNVGISIDTRTEDIEELWNGIVALRFIGPYLLCIRTRSIELYDIPFPFPKDLQYFVPSTLGSVMPNASRPQSPPHSTSLPPVASHVFASLSFRAVSIASPLQPVKEVDTTTTTLSFLANDVLRGLFHYRLDVLVFEDQDAHPPELRVRLIGAYTGIHGFVSSIALGPQNLRGVWIERTRNNTARRVVTFTTSRPAFEAPAEVLIWRAPDAEDFSGEEDAENVNETEQRTETGGLALIEGKVVYEVHSYDLRGEHQVLL
ncbi:hypothetical protein K488DRAFT_88110 [Vararia minispora EC-137]|uniref:Uncharacterized protein n=1 Tax=Vararia minispora EC-137 TaxID=1314806 RepID=A0ACB8QEP4_9AGAM|nr:hypothetical protein K488DRAFT_88110 [Vararia minispora EC-137]